MNLDRGSAVALPGGTWGRPMTTLTPSRPPLNLVSMARRPAIVHLVLAFVLAALAWGPVSVCATDDERAVCACATVEAPDVETSILTVESSATAESRTASPALAEAAAAAGTTADFPPSTSCTPEAGTAAGAAPLFLIHCAFLC